MRDRSRIDTTQANDDPMLQLLFSPDEKDSGFESFSDADVDACLSLFYMDNAASCSSDIDDYREIFEDHEIAGDLYRFIMENETIQALPQPKAAPVPPRRTVPQKGRRTAVRVLNILLVSLCIAVMTCSAAFALARNHQNMLFGYRFYIVQSDSMAPGKDSPPGGFRKGAIIVVKHCDPFDIKVGDIVTIALDDKNHYHLTHRVIAIQNHLHADAGLYFVTKGDANDSRDPPVPASMVVGKKVASIPGLGVLGGMMTKPVLLTIVFALSAAGLLWVLGFAVYSSMKAKSKPHRPKKERSRIP